MLTDLSNKVAVVTGASRGLGAAIAKEYKKRGAEVINLSRTIVSDFETIKVDLSDFQEIEAAILQIQLRVQKIDILVNNAGTLGPRVSLAKYPLEDWILVHNINATAPFLLTKGLLPLMLEGGSIINVGSGLGIVGWAEWGAYSASKFALEGITQIAANELRSKNIRVNIVDPGGVDTDLRQQAFPGENRKNLASPESRTEIFVYLASDESKHITNERFRAANWIKI